MKQRVLITGGAGFIGSSLAGRLASEGRQVVVLDSLSPQIHGTEGTKSALYRRLPPEVRFFNGNVQNRSDMAGVLADVDAVIHLAAETGTGQSMYEIAKYVEVNVQGTALLWDIIANSRTSIKKVLVASSRSIYGEGEYYCTAHGTVYPLAREVSALKAKDFEPKCPVCGSLVTLRSTRESAAVHPTSIYGFTKQAQEEMSLVAGAALGIPVVALRYQNVYGPGQSLKNPYTGILSIFSTRILNSNKINLFEDGLESRDFVYIEDVVQGTVLALDKADGKSRVYNIGSGVPVTVKRVAELLVKSFGRQTELEVSGHFRIGDIRHNFADISLARRELGFEPRTQIELGLEKFVDWVKTQEVEPDRYERSILDAKDHGLFQG